MYARVVTIAERIGPAVTTPTTKIRSGAAWWWAVPEVRWAGAAAALFVLGLATQLLGTPA